MRPSYVLGSLTAVILGITTIIPPAYAPINDRKVVVIKPDERSELIARMKNIMMSRDMAKEDPRPSRDKLMSMNESGLFLQDMGIDEGAYDPNAISIGPEKEGDRITIYIPTSSSFTIYKQVTLAQARKYLEKYDKKK